MRPRGTDISRIPLYRQIREYLLENIHAGTWDTAKPIPSENELSQQFQVSRITAKQALETLVEDGLIYRVQGRGSFISLDQKGEPVVHSKKAPEATLEVKPRPLIGYIAPRLNNMFMADVLSAVEGAAAEAGYRLLFARTNDSQEREEEILAEFEALGASGLIVYPVEGELYNEAFLKLMLRRFPLVVIDRYLRGVETDCVCSDNFEAARQATEHLLGLGHRRIAFVSHAVHGTSSVEDRLQGYEAALAASGFAGGGDLKLLTLRTLDERNKKDIRGFLEAHPEVTGIVGVNSGIGRQILEVLTELGRRVPQDVSLVLFDNQEPLPLYPTHIKQQEAQLAREAVQLLVDAIANPDWPQVTGSLESLAGNLRSLWVVLRRFPVIRRRITD